MTDKKYPVLSRGWRCDFTISLNGKPQTINHDTQAGGGFVVGGATITVGGGGASQGLLVGLGSASQGLSLVGGEGRGGASQDLVGGDDQLLGSVTLDCGANITAPTLDIQTDVSDSHSVDNNCGSSVGVDIFR